jgi:hypothetical protein
VLFDRNLILNLVPVFHISICFISNCLRFKPRSVAQKDRSLARYLTCSERTSETNKLDLLVDDIKDKCFVLTYKGENYQIWLG